MTAQDPALDPVRLELGGSTLPRPAFSRRPLAGAKLPLTALQRESVYLAAIKSSLRERSRRCGASRPAASVAILALARHQNSWDSD